ncbi:unnamed protein product [Adineta ricciae]|uniref:G-protein coupled receptors family 1 profile domain-containing protein n=1 Tax=Adineta ricciae TaxID=249248 RepID=A0A815GL66_ADIRI|nr:unnamed protein product [Adineta ricciae]CAF1389545.1 unnamed protein product [Adineta ricciae]
MMSLSYINQQLTIYLGIFLLIIGVIGNGLNILIFSSTSAYRRTPCAFYFLANSVDNILFIGINLISRVVSIGFNFDLTQTSVHWCRARQYFIAVFGLFSFTCACLTSIDQFLVTSRKASLRRLSNIKWTHRIVFILIIICCLHGIPRLVFFAISSNSNTCVVTNTVYSVYITVYSLSLTSIGPTIIMIICGYLTYRNIHFIRASVDRQLVKMTLYQVLLVFITITPYGITTSYILITSSMKKDAYQLRNENFVLSFVSILCYFYYCGSFYIFFISSNRFRRTMKAKLLFWQRANQIDPLPIVAF